EDGRSLSDGAGFDEVGLDFTGPGPLHMPPGVHRLEAGIGHIDAEDVRPHEGIILLAFRTLRPDRPEVPRFELPEVEQAGQLEDADDDCRAGAAEKSLDGLREVLARGHGRKLYDED